MLRILLLFYVVIYVTNAHKDKQTNDAELQSELMPQELNPYFVPAAESQMPAMPLPLRIRRNSVDVATIPENTTIQQVKTYTRIVAGIVLVLAAIVELVAYVLESYAT